MISELARHTPAILLRIVDFILEVIFFFPEFGSVLAAVLEVFEESALFEATVLPAAEDLTADPDALFLVAPVLFEAAVPFEDDAFFAEAVLFEAAALLCASVIRLFCSSVSLLLSAIGFFLPHPAGKQDAFT